jgi:hypothetical protein
MNAPRIWHPRSELPLAANFSAKAVANFLDDTLRRRGPYLLVFFYHNLFDTPALGGAGRLLFAPQSQRPG